MNKNMEKMKKLKDIVGDSLFYDIIRELSGQIIYIADYSGFSSKSERDAAIRNDFFRGMSCRELTEKYALHPSTIYRIIETK